MAVLLPYTLPSLPKTQSDDWVRPSDWPVITDTPNEIWALVNDQGAAFFSFTAVFTGSAFVDWGDGSSPVSLSSGMPFTKSYTPGTGATCSRGYTTFKVRIYGATTWTSVRPTAAVGTAANGSYLSVVYSTGLLEIYYGDGVGIGTAAGYFNSTSGSVNFQQLEYAKFPSVVNSALQMNSMFSGCKSLQMVILPNIGPSASTSFNSTFSGCSSLKSITMPSSGPISSLSSAFSGCSDLKSVIFASASTSTILSNTGGLDSAFANCYNLVSVDLPAITTTTNLSSTFINCYNLRYFRTYGSPSGQSVAAASMFQECRSLEQAIFPNPASASTFSAASMFQVCSSLKNISFPDKILFSSMVQMFQACYTIQRVEFQATSMPALTSMSNMFLNCFNLVSVILPTSASSNVVGTSMFGNCGSIGSFSSSFAFNPTNSMFANCSNLKSVSLPGITASTSYEAIFQNCFNLTNITLPGTLTASTTFNQMFLNCSSLKSFTMPAVSTGGSSTTTNAFGLMFSGCNSLRTLGFTSFGTHSYTSAGANFFNQMFLNCVSLQSLDLSAFSTLTINSTADVTNGQMFNNCNSLKTLKYGFRVQSQGASGTNIAASLLNCSSLTNLDISDAYATTTTNLTWQAIGTATTNIAQVQGMTFSCRFSRFQHNGTVAIRYNLQNLRLTNNAAGQYGGASPQIDVSYTLLGQAALVQLFNDLPTLTSKTINITGCPGAALLTAPERAIATGKGWSITG
jgi:hypothetical protein